MVLYLYLQKFLIHFLVFMSKIVNWIFGRQIFCLFYHIFCPMLQQIKIFILA
jgi:hypothetical protein